MEFQTKNQLLYINLGDAVAIVKYDSKHLGSTLIGLTPEIYNFSEIPFAKMATVDQDIILQHAENEFSYLTNTFNTEIVNAIVSKKDEQ
jgi:hypothetical protein